MAHWLSFTGFLQEQPMCMLEACEMAAHHDAAEHAEAMLNWLRSGGFPPLITVSATGVGVSSAIDDAETNRTIAAAIAMSILATVHKEGG